MNQQQVWNQIAESWNNFRQKPIKELNQLNWKNGKILDIGCGNCRNLLPFKNLDCYGIDFSKNMLKHAKKFARKNNFKVKLKQASAEKIPFKNNYFDYILAIAILHHLKDPEPAIVEIYRVLKIGGKAYISIWNKLQFKFLFKRKEAYIKWGNEKRYYHFISFWDMKKLLKKYNLNIIESKLLGKNLEFLVEKI